MEDETLERVNGSEAAVETEFYGGEQIAEPEDDDVVAGAWRPMVVARQIDSYSVRTC